MTFNKTIKKYWALVVGAVILLPYQALAQTPPTPAPTTGCVIGFKSLRELLNFPVCVINRYLLPFFVTIAFFFFVFGIVRYMFELENEAKRKEMRDFIMWSLLALFVMLSVWGIIYVMANTLRLGE